MTIIKLKKNSIPKVELPSISCDIKLHKKLDKFELTSCFNRSFAAGVLGKPGTGKTSLITGLLATKHLMRNVFFNVFLFMPANSRSSIKDSIFDSLPKERIFDDLNCGDLNSVYEKVRKNSAKNRFSLIVFDDVQQHLKGDCEELLTEMLANRRHLRLCIFMVAQTYKKIPRSCRMLFSDFFFFDVSKSDQNSIYNELINLSKLEWETILRTFDSIRKGSSTEARFLYVCSNAQRYFIGWDELLIGDDSETESETESESETDSDEDSS